MKTFIKRMAVLAAVLLLAVMPACSSCRKDTQPNGAQTETEMGSQSAQQTSSGLESGETDAEDSQEETYNDYGEWDFP